MTTPGQSVSLRWRWDEEALPARVYRADPFDIVWDSGGLTEDGPAGWIAWQGAECLGIAPTLTLAKALVEKVR